MLVMNIIILGCNGNIGKFISVNLASNKKNKVYGIDLHSKFLGENDKIIYFQNDCITIFIIWNWFIGVNIY